MPTRTNLVATTESLARSPVVAEAIDVICEDPSLIAYHGEKLHREIRERFTWESIFGDVANVISQKILQAR